MPVGGRCPSCVCPLGHWHTRPLTLLPPPFGPTPPIPIYIFFLKARGFWTIISPTVSHRFSKYSPDTTTKGWISQRGWAPSPGIPILSIPRLSMSSEVPGAPMQKHFRAALSAQTPLWYLDVCSLSVRQRKPVSLGHWWQPLSRLSVRFRSTEMSHEHTAVSLVGRSPCPYTVTRGLSSEKGPQLNLKGQGRPLGRTHTWPESQRPRMHYPGEEGGHCNSIHKSCPSYSNSNLGAAVEGFCRCDYIPLSADLKLSKKEIILGGLDLIRYTLSKKP